MTSAERPFTIGLVGARGYTGAELIRLIERHPSLSLAFVSSRALAGQRISDTLEGSSLNLVYEDLDENAVGARSVDAVVLALPNGLSQPYVDRIAEDTLIVDVSADHRFDEKWVYGLPEHFREAIRGTKRIANPGCYATGAQMAIRPLLDLITIPPVVFGVSGYSGAGTTPSDKNNPDRLRDNLLPYSLTGHTHELEISRHLNRAVRFTPHVAPFFRGITLTISFEFNREVTREELRERFRQQYEHEPLIALTDEPPEVASIMHRHGVAIGGISVDGSGRHAVVVTTIDNLLKGAATQALQNLNLALGLEELAGVPIGATQSA